MGTNSLHYSRLSPFLKVLLSSSPVHSLILSSNLFFCLPLFLPPRTVPCNMVFASPDDLVTCLIVVKRSSWGPMACLILFRTSSLEILSLYVMPWSFLKHLISMACILLSTSAVSVQDSHAYKNMNTTNERISLICELGDTFLSFQMVLSFVRAAMVWPDLASTSGLDPSSAMITPKYLNLSTQSSVMSLIWMSVLIPLVLLVIRVFFCTDLHAIGCRGAVKAFDWVH